MTLEAIVNFDDIPRTNYTVILGTTSALWLKLSPAASIQFEYYIDKNNARLHEGHVMARQTPKNRWIHVAGCFDGIDELSLFVDGKCQGKQKIIYVPGERAAEPAIDVNSHGGFGGRMDSLRVSNVVRYKEDFSPVAPFTTDANTVVLYQFDEQKGDIAHDSSGNGHDGRIHNPAWRSVE